MDKIFFDYWWIIAATLLGYGIAHYNFWVEEDSNTPLSDMAMIIIGGGWFLLYLFR